MVRVLIEPYLLPIREFCEGASSRQDSRVFLTVPLLWECRALPETLYSVEIRLLRPFFLDQLICFAFLLYWKFLYRDIAFVRWEGTPPERFDSSGGRNHCRIIIEDR